MMGVEGNDCPGGSYEVKMGMTEGPSWWMAPSLFT